MKFPVSSPLNLFLAAALLTMACGRSKDDRDKSSQASNPLVPANFQNTANPEVFQQKNQEAKILLQSIEQQFGMNTREPRATESALVITQAALQAFIGAKSDSRLLSRSLEMEASMALITRLLSDEHPDSCTVVLASVEALYTSLTVAAQEAVTYSDQDHLKKKAQILGMQLEERPTSPDAALSFHLKGSNDWPGLDVEQELDFSAGANDRYVFLKRDAKFTSTLHRLGQDEKPEAEFGHYTYTSTGGLSADLLEKTLIIMDQRRADFDMSRHGDGVRGSSHLDIQGRIWGGELPSITAEMKLNLQGEGLKDETGYSLYNEQRQFTSQLTKVDAQTLRLNLALVSEGVKGSKNLSVEWQLHKNAEGTCTVTRPTH